MSAESLLGNLADEVLRYRGALWSLLALAAWAMLPAARRARVADALDLPHERWAPWCFAAFGLLGAAYVAYPGYLDHVESTVAMLGRVLAAGEPLYPWPALYPYHGLLYGPGVALTQAAAAALPLPVVAASKLPGVLAFGVTAGAAFAACRSRPARGLLLALLPFGLFAFWNRSEPFLTAATALALLAAERVQRPLRAAVLVGTLAGLASAFKLHGAAYVLAAWLAATLGRGGPSARQLPAAALAGLAAFALCFVPASASWPAFLDYLRAAGRHGLSGRLWRTNLLYLGVMLLPLLVLLRAVRPRGRVALQLAAVLMIELGISVLAAKPGAGLHHFMPLLPVHAMLVERLLARRGDTAAAPPGALRVLPTALLLPVALAWALDTGSPMAAGWSRDAAAADELRGWAARHPEAVMGLSDRAHYELAFLRVRLPAQQVDYPAWMDLQFAGRDDAELVRRLHDCRLPLILMPAGTPWAMPSYYTGAPLMSEALRAAFVARYRLLEAGTHYSAWTCR